MTTRRIVSKRWIALLLLALAQMAGDLAGVGVLRGAAAATAASPAPKVFTRVGDSEPFSARFALVVSQRGRGEERVELTPERHARLAGPYNRRNVFGAAIAAAPELVAEPMTQPLFEQVARYALCGDAPVLRELGAAAGAIATVVIERRSASGTVARVRVVCP